MNNVCAACEPAKSRIVEIYEQLQALGNEVVALQKVVNTRRVEYYAIDAKDCEEEKSKGGIVNDIDWMIGDIKRRVIDVRDYVDTL